MNSTRAIKIGMATVTTGYVVCYLLYGLFAGLRGGLMPYVLHMRTGAVENIFTLSNFIIGLIIWNVVIAAVIWLVYFWAGRIRK